MGSEIVKKIIIKNKSKNELEDLPGEKMKPKEALGTPAQPKESQKVAVKEPTCAQGCPKAPKWSQKDAKKETR